MEDYYTNVSFANIYRKPSFHSEIDTQTVLWEKLRVLDKADSFLHIRTEDDYEGWINEHQVSRCAPPQAEWKLVTRLYAPVYRQPDKNSDTLLQTGAGARLPVIASRDNWEQVVLPDGRKGWVESHVFKSMPAFNRQNVIKLAEEFLGTTYIWGGKTPFGLDCSGFVQLIFHLFGKAVRRDAWMQFEDGQPVSDNPLQARPGDLYFFAESGNKITHVGIALGNGKIIHARGLVRINSLNENDADYSPQLRKDFVGTRSYFK